MKTPTLCFLFLVMGCTNSIDKPLTPREDSKPIIEEVTVENPNKKTQEPEKKKVTVHKSGITPMDAIEFIDNYEHSNETADEIDRAERENIKRLLPPHTESKN